MDVSLSYETNKQTIRILKSAQVSNLLYKQYYLEQLKVKIPLSDCILVRMTKKDHEILTENDLKEPIKNYLSLNNEIPHFQLSILIQIIQYDTNQLLLIPISTRNITIKQLIDKIPNRDEIYKYLSSYDTHLIVSNNQQLSDLIETKFYLIKESEICSISIDVEGNIVNQRYAIFAMIADLYKENKEIITNDNQLSYNDIVLSQEILLTCFQQTKSPIQFTLSTGNLNAKVTIINEENNDLILKFQCSPSIEIENLFRISCQLFNVDKNFFQLSDSIDSEMDGSAALFEVVESIDDVQLKLVSTADVKCLITYEKRAVTIPANRATLLSTVLEEALKHFYIPEEQIDMFVLKITENTEDPEVPEEIDASMTIADVLEVYSIQSTIISLQLVKQ